MNPQELSPHLNLPYLPSSPRAYRPAIGLIGCGGITTHHLTAYRSAGFKVVALCDVNEGAARARQAEFYPTAKVFSDFRDLLRIDEIEVVDVATHPPIRPAMIEACLKAKKHVLSQKPFVLDLDVGERLCDLADDCGVRLAVNQNGRWAPHFSYANHAIRAGLLGTVMGAHLSVHWDHSWVRGTEFEKIHHLILYDYAIHWFDIVTCFMGGRSAQRVFASHARSTTQTVAPPLLAQALIEYESAQASLAFDANTPIGSEDRTFIAGSEGTIRSVGPGNRVQSLTLTTATGTHTPELQGSWFPDGFHGTMGELLCAIEDNREPSIDARTNLHSLALCFAAVASSQTHQPFVPGSVRHLPA